MSGAIPAVHALVNAIATPAQSPNWYAIQIRPRFERKVAVQLSQKHVETFLPLRTEDHQWTDRRKVISVPLFRGYAFVRISPSLSEKLMVLRTAGVVGFVSFGSQVARVPEKQIADLQRVLSQKVPCSLYPFLRVGQRVKVCGGCLDGLEGILDQRDAKRLVISVDNIQRSISLAIEGYELEML
jgi:transcription antitermination factor NusG